MVEMVISSVLLSLFFFLVVILFFSFHFWVGITIEEKGFVPFKFPLLLLSFKCRKQWPVFVCLFGWLEII